MSSLLSQNKDEPFIRKSLSDSCPASSAANTRSLRHERPSRLGSSSSSDVSNDTSTNHAESYFLQRESRLSAKKKAEEEKMNSDYKKMYEKALATNQRLKSRLETSKQDLATVQNQLQTVQKGKPDDCTSKMLEAEKKESWSLKKRISDMEEQLKLVRIKASLYSHQKQTVSEFGWKRTETTSKSES
ncbi:protein phosphatase 1 regulatory subunit 12B-like isoform X2 [Xiphophorus maculatus]|nr:protein phosphatase 1 regulatory subunit 12B-like isoform X2 [Xiphophorus maculatus]